MVFQLDIVVFVGGSGVLADVASEDVTTHAVDRMMGCWTPRISWCWTGSARQLLVGALPLSVVKKKMRLISEALLAADLADDVVLLEEAVTVMLVTTVRPEVANCTFWG
jgi:hypothetical protein